MRRVRKRFWGGLAATAFLAQVAFTGAANVFMAREQFGYVCLYGLFAVIACTICCLSIREFFKPDYLHQIGYPVEGCNCETCRRHK